MERSNAMAPASARQRRNLYDKASDAIIRRLYVANCSWPEIAMELNRRVGDQRFTSDSVRAHGHYLGLRPEHRGQDDAVSLQSPSAFVEWTCAMHRDFVDMRNQGHSYADCAARLTERYPEKYFSSAQLSDYAQKNGMTTARTSTSLASLTGTTFLPKSVDDWLWGKEAFDAWDTPGLSRAQALWLCKPRRAGAGGWGFYLHMAEYDGICSGGVVEIWRALTDDALSLDDAIAAARRFFHACKDGPPDHVLAQASAYARTRLDLRHISGSAA